MELVDSQAVAKPGQAQRLRNASLVSHLGTFMLVSFPSDNWLLYRPDSQAFCGVYLIWRFRHHLRLARL